MRALGLQWLSLLLFVAASGSSRAAPTFIGLASTSDTFAPTAVSADGSTVVGSFDHTNTRQPFRWTAGGGVVGLGWLPDGRQLSDAKAVSADGSVVVGTNDYLDAGPDRQEAFRWTQGGGLVGLGEIRDPNNPRVGPVSSAAAVTDDGLTVFGGTWGGAFRWTPVGGMVFLPSDTPGFVRGASGDGSVLAGDIATGVSTQAARWTEATGFVGIGFLGSDTTSTAYAVSKDGSTLVGNSGSMGCCPEGTAFAWTAAGGMVALGPGQAKAVSGDGSVVVGTSSSGAFIWDAVHG